MPRKLHLAFRELGRGKGEMTLRMWLENGGGVALWECGGNVRDSPFGLGLLREGTGMNKMLPTFTFMRSSQKFRGGSTMVVLSSMT